MRLVPGAFLALFMVAGGMSLFGEEALRTLSVLYFTNTAKDPQTDWLSKGLADMLVSDLGSSGAFTVVEREELRNVLQQQELALSGLTDEKDAPKIGALLGAKLLVYGAYVSTAGRLRYDAKAVDVESGKIVGTAAVTGSPASALPLERQLAEELAASLGVTLPDRAPATTSQQAAASYYRGIDSLDAGRYAEAVDLFNRSVREDPSYLKPGQGLEEAYRYLKDFRKQRYQREYNQLLSDIAALRRRIEAPEFYSFADMVQNPRKFGFKDAAEASAYYQAHPMTMNGNTPAQAVWYLQYLYRDLAAKAVDYFGDQAAAVRASQDILSWADAARKAYPKDPFVPELVYQKLLVYRETGDWPKVRDTCEDIMGNYPDYRMIQSVEDFYAEALEQLKQQQ